MARTPDAVVTETELAAPRWATAWAALVYAVSTLLLAYPALSGQFLMNPRSDQYMGGYAFREFAAQSLKSGHGFPQWNSFIMGGLPYVAAMHGDIFYPTFLLRMIVPTDVAMTWEFPIHLFLCGLFTYLFLRAWNLSFWASLAGGLAYMLGGSIAGYAGPGHDGKLFVSTMLPISLLLLTRGVRDGRTWAWGAFALVIGAAVLSPHPQLLQYMLLAAGAFTLYIALADHPGIGKLPRPVAIKRVALAAAGVAVGFLIGAIQYLPVLHYTPWSPRAGGHDWDTATSYSFPIEETLNSYWPQFSGILDNYWGRNLIHFHSDYFGVIVLLLVGASFGAATAKSFKRFWLVTGIVALLWAYGGYVPPFFHIIMAIVPGTKYFRAPSTIIYVVAFAVAVLAAVGMERVLARRTTPKYAIGWMIFGLVFGLLMTVGGYSTLTSGLISGFPLPAPQYVDFLNQRAAANSSDAIAGVWRSFVFVLLGAGAIWAYLTNRIPAKTTAIALAALLVVDLWSIERKYWTFSAPASQLYATDAAIDAIKADIAKNGPGRVWNEPLNGKLADRDANFKDALMSHDLRVVQGYHGNEIGAYDQLLGTTNLVNDGRTFIPSPYLWRHENIRYLYTGADESTVAQLAAQMKSPPFEKLAGPVKDAAGSMVYAYRLPGDNPAAVVASAIAKAPQSQALPLVLDPGFNPATVAVADTIDKDITGIQLQAIPAATAVKAAVTRFEPGAIDVTLDQPATAGQALVVSENYYPGWRATVDGKAAPAGMMNYNLIGVALPAGAKSIQLRFADPAYETGKRITLAAILLAVVGLGFGLVAGRRRPSGTVAA